MKIHFYTKGSNRNPVKDFINKQNVKDRAKIYGSLSSIEKSGLDSIRGNHRYIKHKVWELKIRLSVSSISIFYVSILEDNMVSATCV